MSGIDPTVDFKSFQDKVQSSLVRVTKTSAQISNEDLGFHRASSRKFSKTLDDQNARLLRLTNKLIKAAIEDSNVKAPKLADADSIDDNWKKVVDVVDDMLEKADASLDEFSGVIKRFSPAPQDGAATPTRVKQNREVFNNYQNASMPKPQRLFDVKPNNYETKPFRPLLKTKPHATVPLLESIGEDGPNGYNHPYATEIEQYRYPPTVYQSKPLIPYNPPGDYEATFVDTEEGVQEMLKELKQAKEIAVDLEHHDTHSYIGLVSLMQISTRDKDWIVDPLKPWRENLQCLNEVFTDPNIIKVFHGATMDIRWLQRDLGLYVVGLFDTFHAASALNFPGKSLKYLLERFVNFKAQKKYQMADWRIRPLPTELVDYARSDTHYLLYIYDELRNMLAEASTPGENLTDAVLEGSKKEALQIYERPIYDLEYGLGSGGWFKQVTQRSIKFDGPQLAVYKAVHHWRDQKAREWDEGEQSILTMAQLYGLAEAMPTTVSALYNSLRPISKLVGTNSKELVSVIAKAQIQGQNQPSLRDVVKATEEMFGTSVVWGRKAQRLSPAENYGVGSTLQMLTKSGDMTPTTVTTPDSVVIMDDAELNSGRLLTSGLWGLTLSQSSSSSVKSSSVAAQALRSILPLDHHLDTSVTRAEPSPVPLESSQTDLVASVPTLSSDSPAATVLSAPKPTSGGRDEIFTLRDRKRKVGEVTGLDDDPAVNDHILSTEDEARKEEKKRRKAEKRAQKEAATASAAQVQPFDYANAQSMLNAQLDPAEQKVQNSKLINPYAKALNTSTGAKRTNQEGPGRSFTFKR